MFDLFNTANDQPAQTPMFDDNKNEVTIMFNDSGALVISFAVVLTKQQTRRFRDGLYGAAHLVKDAKHVDCAAAGQTCIEITFKTGAKYGHTIEESRQLIRAYAQRFMDNQTASNQPGLF